MNFFSEEVEKILIVALIAIIVGWVYQFLIDPFLDATIVLIGYPMFYEWLVDGAIKGLFFWLLIAFGFIVFRDD